MPQTGSDDIKPIAMCSVPHSNLQLDTLKRELQLRDGLNTYGPGRSAVPRCRYQDAPPVLVRLQLKRVAPYALWLIE